MFGIRLTDTGREVAIIDAIQRDRTDEYQERWSRARGSSTRSVHSSAAVAGPPTPSLDVELRAPPSLDRSPVGRAVTARP
jgi:hypothetical protein